MKLLCGVIFALLCTCSSLFADSLINAWTNPASGNWEDLSWSLGARPGPGQSIQITNQGWKAVAIGPNTVLSFPETLNVDSVTLGGYTDSFNTLLLNYAGLVVPLTTGSLLVGTNSGVTALGSALNVSTNSGSGDLSLFSVFNQGALASVTAHSITLGNVTNAAAGAGTYNETNGTLAADALSAWMGSTINQLDGATTVAGALSLGGAGNSSNLAHYTMAGGLLTAGSIELQQGDFNQTGGSVTAGLDIGAATYTLSGGTLQLPGITIPWVNYGPQNPNGFAAANATLLQTGGTNFCNGTLTAYHEYGAPGVPLPFLGPGRYVLSNGVLCVSGTVRAWLGSFEQWGGSQTNGGIEVTGDTYPNWVIETGSFTLGGGTLITPSISISLGEFTQSDGTGQVSGTVDVGGGGCPANFTLTGGLLADLNASVDASHPATPGGQQALFTQSGGTHIVTNLLHIIGPPTAYPSPFTTGSYVLSGGQLTVPNIQMDAGGFFDHQGGTVTTSGLLNLGLATWYERTTGQQFGQFLLSAPPGTNATLSLPAGKSCVVHFADSSSVVWSNQATFLLDNWSGSPGGGGQQQVVFGSSASSLTPQQVSQVRFRNPDGASGIFPAHILSTGELVPDRFLAAHKSSGNLVIEWSNGTLQSATNISGPYENVSGATSPYSAPMTEPARFFRISE